MNKRRYTGWLILFALALFINIFSHATNAVEQYYSCGIYPYVARFQRLLFGWLPFSIGDILYLVIIIYIVRGIIVFIKKIIRRELPKQWLWLVIKQFALTGMIIYVSFNILWGLNYNRLPMAQRFGLKMETYSTDELKGLIGILTNSLNAIDAAGIKDRDVLKTKKTIFDEAADTYGIIGEQLPDLRYRTPSVKPSLFGYVGNYLGFSGYYNPFSGEAQVNTTMPRFVQPFVACHEIGHQLGYAKEDEANFAGFLAGSASSSDMFRYSTYFDMYAYARREMYLRDSITMRALHEKLRPSVRNDFQTLRRFYQQYENPLEPLIRVLYAEYLKANQQPKGIMSYNEVIAMLIAHYKKTGALPSSHGGNVSKTMQSRFY